MAGHSKFKNIMHRKGAQDAKRAKAFTKVVREIIAAAKSGQIDPLFNPRLRVAIALAKSLNVPKDKIEAALKRASNPSSSDNYEEIRYEGYGRDGIAIIVEALTDNKNRTASEVRSAFTKSGGNLGETGSVSFMFKHIGYIEYNLSNINMDEIFELAIEAGAEDIINNEESYEIICSPENLGNIRDKLNKKFGDPNSARLIWQPLTTNHIEGDSAEKLIKLIETLEDNDDVQHIYGNYEFPDEIAKNF